MDYPKLRNLNIFPIKSSNQILICFQDPQNISNKVLFIPPEIYFIISLFDGKHSILDIQVEYMRRFGEFLFKEKIEEVVNQLDESLFLYSDRFEKVLKEKEKLFKKSLIREAQFAGKSYEREPDLLRAQLEGYFNKIIDELQSEQEKSNSLKGIVAPHIDFLRGGTCYAFAYKEMIKKNQSKCFIIIGTSHLPLQNPFCLTKKDFETPFGIVPVDKELVDAIQSRYPYDLLKDEIAHRSEHSIEFQCIFLRYIYPNPYPLMIVPILSGSLHEVIGKKVDPRSIESISRFIDALKESISSLGRDVCYIASADLTHMGLQFGDPQGINDYELRIIKEEDLSMLRYVENIDGKGFFSSIMRDRDRRRICGLSAIYTLLEAIEAKKGKILKYDQAFTSETGSVVSFASIAFYD